MSAWLEGERACHGVGVGQEQWPGGKYVEQDACGRLPGRASGNHGSSFSADKGGCDADQTLQYGGDVGGDTCREAEMYGETPVRE